MHRLTPLLLLLAGCAAYAQEPPSRPLNRGASQAIAAPAEAGSKAAAALTLSAPESAEFRPGKLITVQAKGQPAGAAVSWKVHVFPEFDLDYAPQGDVLLLAMPPASSEVWVVAGSGGQLAEATIKVTATKAAQAAPPLAGAPGPAGAPAGQPAPGRVRHLTLVSDNLAPAARALSQAPTLRDGCAARQVKLHGPVDIKTALGLGLNLAAGQNAAFLQAGDGGLVGQPLPLGETTTAEQILAWVDAANAGGK